MRVTDRESNLVGMKVSSRNISHPQRLLMHPKVGAVSPCRQHCSSRFQMSLARLSLEAPAGAHHQVGSSFTIFKSRGALSPRPLDCEPKGTVPFSPRRELMAWRLDLGRSTEFSYPISHDELLKPA